MATLMRKHVLWAGPEDGLEVTVEKDAYQFFVTGPPKLTPDNIISGMPGADAEVWLGRYQYNSITNRFEWMGYE